jgi:hypothetical protein
MTSSTLLIALTLLTFAFSGCSRKEPVVDLGVIELTPNVPKHIKIGDRDWMITEKQFASGKQTITAESAEGKVIQNDIPGSLVPPNPGIGATVNETMDLSDLPTGVETVGDFGNTLVRYTLKYE